MAPSRGGAQKPGHEDMFYNNTCISSRAAANYANFQSGIGGSVQIHAPSNHEHTVE